MIGRSVWIAAVVLLLQTLVTGGELPSTMGSEEGAKTSGSVIEVAPTKGDRTRARSADNGSATLSPSTLRVKHGERAVFTYNADDEASEILKAHQGNQKGYQYILETKDMEPAKYFIRLKVTDVTLKESRTVSAVLYVEALPGEIVKVPDVIGEQKEAAMAKIEEAGLRVGEIEESVSKLDPGMVIMLNPHPGAKLKSGSKVDLVVAKAEHDGKPTAVIEPKLMWIQQGERARFQSRSTYAADAAVTEAWSGPAGKGTGKTFDVDTTGLEPGKYTVDLQISDAARQLSDTVSAVLYVEAEPAAVEPAPVEVKPAPVKTVPVPDLVGQDQQQVAEMLEKAGLHVGKIEERDSDLKAGTVLAQHPAAGAALRPGGTVDLVIAKGAPYRLEVSAAVDYDNVTLHAAFTPEQENAEYHFDFGDGHQSGWQKWGKALHRYSAPGNYTVFVEARIGEKRFKEIRSVEVLPWSYTLKLTETPSDGKADGEVTVHAELVPPREEVRYRFDFGDGSLVKEQMSANAAHTYSSGGMYRVDVQAAVEGEEVKEHLFVTVPDQGVSPVIYGILGLLALVTAGGFYYFFKQEEEETVEEDIEKNTEGDDSKPSSGNSTFPHGTAPWE
jgi:PKD repeat protein